MKVLVTALTLMFSGLCFAEENYDMNGKWGVGLGAGFNNMIGSDAFTEGTNELGPNFTGGLWVRYHFSQRFAVELAYTRLVFDYENDSSVTLANLDPAVDVLDLNIAYRMWPTSAWHGLIQFGLGYAKQSDIAGVNGNEDDFVMKLRLGPEYMLNNELMLGAYADLHHVNVGSGDDSELVTVSPLLALTYYFGAGPKKETVKKVDTDGDGIDDKSDKCPGTKAGVTVDGNGCPLPIDSDGDGVADKDDQCPATPAGKPVTNYGCTQTQKLEFILNVQFALGSSRVNQAYTADLEKFANFLKKFENTKAEIEGHTDNTGSETVNYRLSQKRAESVRRFIIKKFAVPADRLTAKGYGPSQPVAENKTAAGRKKNRRVVAHVQTTVEKGAKTGTIKAPAK